MKKAIILTTELKAKYWGTHKRIFYPNTNYQQLIGWEKISKSCPLPGIGISIKENENEPYANIIILEMKYNSKKEPLFKIKFLNYTSKPSKKIIERLPQENIIKSFSAISIDELRYLLSRIGETPPNLWLKVIDMVEPNIYWQDYIGEYFYKLYEPYIFDDIFEDIVAKLLNAIGFKIIQKGYKISEKCADGIAFFENDYAIVYDCKNKFRFLPTEEDIIALQEHLNEEKRKQKGKYFYNAFIAKSFKNMRQTQEDILYIPINSLLFLLYKRMAIGAEFSLRPLKKILNTHLAITIELIDEEWD